MFAFDGDQNIVLALQAQQYGGFTVPDIELILEPYAEEILKAGIERYEGLSYQKTRRRRSVERCQT